jgi:hypothetical protein
LSRGEPLGQAAFRTSSTRCRSTHVTETVYRHVIVPAIRGGATVMDGVFGEDDTDDGSANAENV